ncbi:hypothetical protein L1887_11685 [Cichorium endivia]|nr:hypothetical protein L1887_11685 [Cichorium endivia]
MIQQEDDAMWCLLIDDGPAYLTFWMEITTNHGTIACARFVDGSQEFDDEKAIKIARIIVWYESKSLHADGLLEEKISKLLVTIRGMSKEEEEEGEGAICVVYQEEYETDKTIVTINCGHVYHERCITNG